MPSVPAKGYDLPPLLFTLVHVSCNFVLPAQCHQLNFVSYVPYNDKKKIKKTFVILYKAFILPHVKTLKALNVS